jgi:hypothetical protein
MFHPWPDDQPGVPLATLIMRNAEPLRVDIFDVPAVLSFLGNVGEEHILDPDMDFEWSWSLTPRARGLSVTSRRGPALRMESQATAFTVH